MLILLPSLFVLKTKEPLPLLVETLVAEGTVEALDVGVLHRRQQADCPFNVIQAAKTRENTNELTG